MQFNVGEPGRNGRFNLTYQAVGIYGWAMNEEPLIPSAADWSLSWCGHETIDTRQKILLAAFKEIHLYGYQSASIQNIINHAGVTKGALYHYFKSKHEMAIALLDEFHAEYVEHTFIQPMEGTDDPISVLIGTIYSLKDKMSDAQVAQGCPLDSLAQEMAPIDEQIQARVDKLYQYRLEKLVEAFERGQAAGKVKQEISAESIALMVTATLQGCMGLAKSARSAKVLTQCGKGLIHYLEALRAQ